MLDIGLFELIVVAIIALLVVGPERVPYLVRSVIGWVQRIKRFIGSVQQDIERDIQAEDLRQMAYQTRSSDGQSVTKAIKDTIETTKNTLNTIKHNSGIKP
ncbi:MAG: Sec-independent protein translocase protein TatB [Pseudomonadota bacterium]